MSTEIEKRPNLCYICGATADTRDHIPPKSIFPKPLPLNLITVPACKNCNCGSADDDHYFRVCVIGATADTDDRAKKMLYERVIPGFHREPNLGHHFRNAIVPSAEVRSAGGIITGWKPAFEVDYRRIRGVVSRIVRGLFFHETGRILRNGYGVSVTVGPDPKPLLRRIPFFGAYKRIGGVFGYRYAICPGDADISIWMFGFYGLFMFAGMTDRIGAIAA
jgi:hypothetical protein